jgi:lipoprotein-anchoring transpeptidase ErfK/SrfK
MGVVMIKFRAFHAAAALATMVVAGCFASSASAAPFNLFQMPLDQQPAQSMQTPADEGELSEAPARFKRQVVDYRTNELPGTIIIDTPNTYLYLVLGNGRALRYASASAARASPGRARRRSRRKPSGRIGRRPRK